MGDEAAARLPDAGAIRTKGFTLKGAMAFVEQRYGREGMERVLMSLDAESRAALEGQVLSSAWFPFRLQVALYEAVDRAFGQGDFALCRQIGRFTAEFELSTIHKMSLKLSSLSIWLRTAGLLWGQYYSAGKLRTERVDEGGGLLLVTEFNPISKAFCTDLAGWLERTAELSGKRGVAVRHSRCLLDGHDGCAYEASWEK